LGPYTVLRVQLWAKVVASICGATGNVLENRVKTDGTHWEHGGNTLENSCEHIENLMGAY
jgi:hypothetical protein